MARGTGAGGVNYIYGTWQVLRGLRAIGQDMTQDWILRGRDWLESCQKRRRRLGAKRVPHTNILRPKEKGESTASQTSWAIMGICACGDLNRPSVQRGFAFIFFSTQQGDGSWNEPQINRHRFPRGVLLKIRHVPAKTFRSLRLATYVNYRCGLGHPPSFFPLQLGFRISSFRAQSPASP